MALKDRRDEMSPSELAEELELRFPEEVVKMESRYPEAWQAVFEEDLDSVSEEELEDLLDDLRAILRV